MIKYINTVESLTDIKSYIENLVKDGLSKTTLSEKNLLLELILEVACGVEECENLLDSWRKDGMIWESSAL